MQTIRVPGSKSVSFSVAKYTATPSLPVYHVPDTQLKGDAAKINKIAFPVGTYGYQLLRLKERP